MNNFEGLKKIWFEPGTFNQYYPLTYSSFWLENKIWNLEPRGYHALNIVLHALNAFLLFLTIRHLGISGSFWISLIFLIHPLQVESVAWITERKNVLSGLFYFGALLFYFRFSKLLVSSDSGLIKSFRISNYILSLCCYILALLSKTVTVTLPAVILLLHFWKERVISKNSIVSMIPFFIVGLALCLIPSELERQHVLIRCGVDCLFNGAERLIIAGGVFWFYFWKLILPINLTFIYPRWEISAANPSLYLLPASAIALIIILWLGRSRWGRGPLTGVLFYSGTIFPAMGFISYYPIRYSFVADHFQYLAGIGWIVLWVSGIQSILKNLKAVFFFPGIRVLIILICMGIPVMGFLAWIETHSYKNEETLYRHILKKNPNSWMPLYNLGIIFLERNQSEKALNYLTHAVKSKPEFSNIHNNLGIALSNLGLKDEAILRFRRTLDLNPNSIQGRSNLAALLIEKGLYHEAQKNLEIILDTEPGNFNALFVLGNLYLDQNNFVEAIKYYKLAVSKKKNYPELHYNLGSAFYGLNRLELALLHFKIALLLRPDWQKAMDKVTFLSSVKKK
tara:strand:- start:144 stop:1841 length:1698 start_codon:yes stop_codon:yes gene_type:complete